LNYHPGPGNIHEFPDYNVPVKKINDEELIRQFELGEQIDDHDSPNYRKHNDNYRRHNDYDDYEE